MARARSSGRRVLIARLETGGKRLDAILLQGKADRGLLRPRGQALRRGFRRYPGRLCTNHVELRLEALPPDPGHLPRAPGHRLRCLVRHAGKIRRRGHGGLRGPGRRVRQRRHDPSHERLHDALRPPEPFRDGIRAGKHVNMDEVDWLRGHDGAGDSASPALRAALNGKPIDYKSAKLPTSPHCRGSTKTSTVG